MRRTNPHKDSDDVETLCESNHVRVLYGHRTGNSTVHSEAPTLVYSLMAVMVAITAITLPTMLRIWRECERASATQNAVWRAV